MSSEKGDQDEAVRPGEPRRSGLHMRLHEIVSSPHFQSAMQLTLGMFVISLFIFITELKYYYNTCLAVTLFIVNSIMMAQDNHVGSKFMASSFLIGSALLGITTAGIMLSISKTILVYKGPKPPHPMLPGPNGRPVPQELGSFNFANFGRAEDKNGSYIALSSVLAVVGLGLLSINRVAENPPFLWVLGMVSCLVTGMVFIDGLYVPTVDILWNVNIRYFLVNVLLSSAIALVTAVLVLPTYASSEARTKLCQALTATGKSIHRSVTVLASSDPANSKKVPHVQSEKGVDDLVDPENEMSDDAFLQMLQEWTKPAAHPPKKASSKKSLHNLEADAAAAPPPGPPPVSSLRPLLARARMCAVSSQAEPLFLQPRPLSFGPFMGLVTNVEALLTKASALESLLEDPDINIAGLTAIGGEGHNALLLFKDIMAKVAAQCDILAQALEHPEVSAKGPLVRSAEWAAASKEVGEAITFQLKAYWTAVRAKEVQAMARVKDVRSLMLLVSISYSILETITTIERLSMAVINFPPASTKTPAPPKGDVESGGPQPAADAAQGSPPSPPGGPPPHAGPQLPPWAAYWFGWLIFLLPLVTMLPALHHIFEVLFKQVPTALRSANNFKAALKSNLFKAWIKYWLGLSVVLVLVIVIGYEFPNQARTPPPLFGFAAAALALSEKVEATVSKIVVWIAGTVLGAVLGYVVMLRENLADNPYGLMALICAYTFIVGIASATQMRIAATLTLMTFMGLVACQYKGWCREGNPCEETRLRAFAFRILSVSFGAFWAAAITNLVFPWYNSSWAMATLGEAYRATSEASRRAYLQFFKEGHLAAQQTESLHGDRALQGAGAREQKDHSELHDPTVDEPLQPFIKANIEARLTAVQVSLVKDAAFWKNGLLSTPVLLLQVLAGMQAELDRLSMVQMALMRPPVTGTFSGWAFRLMLEEMHPKFMDVLDKLHVLTAVVAEYMSGYRHNANMCLNIDGLCADLDNARLAARHQLIEQRKVLYRAVLDAPEDQVPYLTHVDDSVRFMSFLGSFIKVVDKIESVARTVSQECHWKFEQEWLK